MILAINGEIISSDSFVINSECQKLDGMELDCYFYYEEDCLVFSSKDKTVMFNSVLELKKNKSVYLASFGINADDYYNSDKEYYDSVSDIEVNNFIRKKIKDRWVLENYNTVFLKYLYAHNCDLDLYFIDCSIAKEVFVNIEKSKVEVLNESYNILCEKFDKSFIYRNPDLFV